MKSFVCLSFEFANIIFFPPFDFVVTCADIAWLVVAVVYRSDGVNTHQAGI